MNTVSLICPTCNVPFTRSIGSYNRALQINKDAKIFCSQRCRFNTIKPLISCAQCQVPTDNPRFCSSRCAAIYNNHHMPKRGKSTKHCKGCGEPSRHSTNRCRKCRPRIDHSKRTLAELKTVCGSRNSFHTVVRQHAQSIAKSHSKLQSCKICEYTHCVECCHIIPVSHFPLETSLAKVNDPRNLEGLCPNHHWELDHGFLNMVPGEGYDPPASSL